MNPHLYFYVDATDSDGKSPTGRNQRSELPRHGRPQPSDKLHVTEVFEKTGPDSFTWTVTYDDPVYFAKPWSNTLTAKRQKYDIMEMICTDNNQHMPRYTTSKLKP
jgi:hypothetical protein